MFLNSSGLRLVIILTLGLMTTGSFYPSGFQRVSNPVLHFEFAREECLKQRFKDSVTAAYFGELVRERATECNVGLGVSLSNYVTSGSSQVLSTNDARYFVNRMSGKSSFTIELWAAAKFAPPMATSTANRPAVTVGAVGDVQPNTCESAAIADHSTFSFTLTDQAWSNDLYFYYSVFACDCCVGPVS